MRLADAARHYVHGITHHTWACVGGPCCGQSLAVSRLAAWTGWCERREPVVQTVGTPFVRSGVLPLDGQVIVGHYGQPHVFAPWFAWEPAETAETYAELLRDHKTSLGWRHAASPASWDLFRELVPCPEKKA